jgi:ketosteroid isomerase-like protein
MDEGTRAQLQDLAVRYAAAADHGDVENFADVFTENATLTVHNGGSRDEIRGRDRLRRIPERLARYDRTFHSLGQAQYWSNEPGHAEGEVLCTASHVRGRTNSVMYIRYEDGYQKSADGTWRIQRRDVQVQWTETHAVDP